MTVEDIKNLPEDFKKAVKELYKRFDIAPVTQPVVQNPVQAPVTLSESKLQDGTVVKYESLTPGAVLTVVGPDGELPAPSGEHTLEDGTKIVVGEGGKIESVTPGQAPPMMNNAPQAPNILMEKHEKLKAEFSALSVELAKQKQSFEAQVKKLNDEVAVFKKDVAEFIGLFNAISDIPSAKPIETPKNKHEKPSRLNRIINAK